MKRLLLLFTAVCLLSISAAAADFTLFGGIQHSGNITIGSAESTTGTFLTSFDPRTFGVYGVRLDHGKIIGGDHTLSYSPSFINSGTKAFNYSSDLMIGIPVSVVKPYAVAGLGLISTGGSGLASFGTKFAINYGGGIKVKIAGPLGGRFDVRGYSVPSVKYKNFNIQSQGLSFVEVTAGIVLGF